MLQYFNEISFWYCVDTKRCPLHEFDTKVPKYYDMALHHSDKSSIVRSWWGASCNQWGSTHLMWWDASMLLFLKYGTPQQGAVFHLRALPESKIRVRLRNRVFHTSNAIVYVLPQENAKCLVCWHRLRAKLKSGTETENQELVAFASTAGNRFSKEYNTRGQNRTLMSPKMHTWERIEIMRIITHIRSNSCRENQYSMIHSSQHMTKCKSIKMRTHFEQ